MLNKVVTSIFGTKHERDVKAAQPMINAVNALEEDIRALNDDQLRAKTDYFRNKLDMGASLDDILVEAFAVVREVAWRKVHMRHFDVQLIGGVVLHQGRIAEMKTGEGKTLVATLPAYLNALTRKGVHIVTVNDYLARRDAEWMGPVYRALGMEVGIIQAHMSEAERMVAYKADITYGQNNEFGFDYLRDNMKFSLEQFVQRGHYFAIVDEVDSILVDEARTPLIISGPTEESTDKYYRINRIIPKLTKKIITGKETSKWDDKPDTDEEDFDYLIDEKSHTAVLTERGVATAEKLLNIENLYHPGNMALIHHINQALKAHALFKRDVNYVVKDGGVIIVDEFTGRMMDGRRWSDGLHQAVEAKEGVKIAQENQTLATVTFQNYFRMYEKLAGMTGTAETEAEEFEKIYKLDVAVIPTNKTLLRDENPDVIFRTHGEKVEAIAEEIRELHEQEVTLGDTVWTGRPALVGTVSIEKSEELSRRLDKLGIPHNVLNAKFHEREAEIVAQAGRVGAITIATNMAGRGTDILLGGNPEFLVRQELGEEVSEEQYEQALAKAREEWEQEHQAVIAMGGLHIVGTERHEARRIDNQLRGRAGRQGDPGSSRFFLSFEDDLLRIFGMDRISGLMQRVGMQEGVPIEHRMVSNAIERSQKQVEQRNFSIRKHLLEYDDVMNAQRNSVYQLRRQVLSGEIGRDYILDMTSNIIDWITQETIAGDDPENWNYESCAVRLNEFFALNITPAELQDKNMDELVEELRKRTESALTEKEAQLGEENFNRFLQFAILSTIDEHWKDHLYALDHLKEGIGLRGYGGRQPLVEFKKESYDLFSAMQESYENNTIQRIYRLQVKEAAEEDLELEAPTVPMFYSAPDDEPDDLGEAKPARRRRPRALQVEQHHAKRKVGRNEPCPCGSGKKYKKCCLPKGIVYEVDDRAVGQ
ncbi:MAG TPA: preprotein translocase subunit SecA [Acidobacteriota bacterium]|nr:preprotein translocase subunit SecA [Acidobacteriota bacterium]